MLGDFKFSEITGHDRLFLEFFFFLSGQNEGNIFFCWSLTSKMALFEAMIIHEKSEIFSSVVQILIIIESTYINFNV